MRRRFYYDKDLDAVLEYGNNHYEPTPEGPSVISDDLGAGIQGLKHLPSGKMLDSKSAHYRETKAAGLEHVGNQTDFASKKEKPSAGTYMRETLDARAQIASNHNGTRDWLARQKEQGRNIPWNER